MGDEYSSAGIGYYAMRLALTRTLAEEMQLKTELKNYGLKYAVTETGGRSSSDFYRKLSRAIQGAAFSERVIEKIPPEIHALIHAAEEAKNGVIINIHSETSLALKVAIVRNNHWVAVAMFGESAMHMMTSHERCGLGIMHI